MLVLFIGLRFVGVRSTIASFFLSVVLTILLNVGLSYYYEARARRNAGSDPRRRDADIRWREDDDRGYRDDRDDRDYRDEPRYREERRG